MFLIILIFQGRLLKHNSIQQHDQDITKPDRQQSELLLDGGDLVGDFFDCDELESFVGLAGTASPIPIPCTACAYVSVQRVIMILSDILTWHHDDRYNNDNTP
jgi:hypothetical protein